MVFDEDVEPTSRFEIQNAVNTCRAEVALKRRHDIPRHLVEYASELNSVAKLRQIPLRAVDVIACTTQLEGHLFPLRWEIEIFRPNSDPLGRGTLPVKQLSRIASA